MGRSARSTPAGGRNGLIPRRPLIAVLALPGTVTVLVPLLLVARSGGMHPGAMFPRSLLWVPIVAGSLFLIVGLRLMASTIRLFHTQGQGTLAPWAPTRHLVVDGPYRHVRNPMISGVLAVLLAEALLSGSSAMLLWFVAFALINAVYIPLAEEPGLGRRFGDEYRAYRAAVPRWLPQREPFFGAWEAEDAELQPGPSAPPAPAGESEPSEREP